MVWSNVTATKGRGCVSLNLVFFKQKTLYELATGLEFRRVLFRSCRGLIRHASRYAPRVHPHNHAYSSTGSRQRELDPRPRSEERRAGKECRCLVSLNQVIKEHISLQPLT